MTDDKPGDSIEVDENYYRRTKKHIEGLARKVDIPITATNPTMKRRLHERNVRQNIPGAGDLFAKGRCGELGLNCGQFYSFGYRACDGGSWPGPDGKPIIRTPCPYAPTGSKPTTLPFLKGKHLQDFRNW